MAYKEREGPAQTAGKPAVTGAEKAALEATQRPPSTFVAPPRQTGGELERNVKTAEARLDGLSNEVGEVKKTLEAGAGEAKATGVDDEKKLRMSRRRVDEYDQKGAEAHSKEIREKMLSDIPREEGNTPAAEPGKEKTFREKVKEFFQKVLYVLSYLNPATHINAATERNEKKQAEKNKKLAEAENKLAAETRGKENLRYSEEINAGMVSVERLGQVAYDAVSSSPPPVLTTEERRFFDLYEKAYESSAGGIYFNGTNHIMLSADVVGEADQRQIIAHEQRHYYSFACRMKNMYNFPGGLPPRWLDEGLTELGSQRYVRGEGQNPKNVGYRTEVITCAYLEKVVQKELGAKEGALELEQAYFTGDFSKVKEATDKALGKGTFDEFMKKENGADALQFLVSKVKDAGIDRTGWNDEAVLRATGMNLEKVWKRM